RPACGNRAVVVVCEDPKSVEGAGRQNVYLYDTSTGGFQTVATLDWVRHVAVSNAGRFFAVQTSDPKTPAENVIGVWDLETGGRLHHLLHAPDLHEWAFPWFSPDDRYLVAVCPDETILLWDVASGQLLSKAAAPHAFPSVWF